MRGQRGGDGGVTHSFGMIIDLDILLLETLGWAVGTVSVVAMTTVEEFIAALPKAELHVHLVGSAPVATVLELARRHPDRGVPVSEEGLREFYTFRDFPHFIDVYTAVSGLVREPEDLADLVRGAARVLAAQNVRYAEFQFGPYAFQRIGMPDAVITEALDARSDEAGVPFCVTAVGAKYSAQASSAMASSGVMPM